MTIAKIFALNANTQSQTSFLRNPTYMQFDEENMFKTKLKGFLC